MPLRWRQPPDKQRFPLAIGFPAGRFTTFHQVVFLVYGKKLIHSVSPLHYLYQHNLESSKKRHTHSRRHTLRTAHTAQERISITVEPRLPGTALNSLAANNAPG